MFRVIHILNYAFVFMMIYLMCLLPVSLYMLCGQGLYLFLVTAVPSVFSRVAGTWQVFNKSPLIE